MLCLKHGVKQIPKKCSVKGCNKFAKRRGVLCISHGAVGNYKRCSSVERYNALAQNGDVYHLDEAQVYKPHSCTQRAKVTALDSDDEEELLGALFYKLSRTAQLRAELAQLQKGNANSDT